MNKPRLKTTLTKVVSTSFLLFTASQQLIAAESEWSCRVSGDGTSWDCYKDGNLVMQPMPQAIKAIPENSTIVEVPVAEQIKQAEQMPSTQALPEKTEAATKATPEKVKPATETMVKAVKEPTVAPVKSTEVVKASPTKEMPVAETQSSKPEVIAPKPKSTTASNQTNSQPTKIAAKQNTYCQSKPKGIVVRNKPTEKTDTIIDADDAVLNDDTGEADFTGNVSLDTGDQKITADKVHYNSKTSDMNAKGNLNYKRSDLSFQGESAAINLDSEVGQANRVDYQITASSARGTADQLNMHGNGVSTYKNTTYTTCPQGVDDWIFSAGEVQLDDNTGVGTAEDVQIFFKDVQIAYLPRVTFPMDDRRKSGFLVPSIGATDTTGTDISIPYYFNLAPNYDATITPRIMSKRGLSLGGEFRHKNEKSDTEFAGEILPNDDEYTGNDDTRGAASLINTTAFTDRLNASVNLNYVSDNNYMEDLGDSLAMTSTQHLERTASLNYNGDYYTATALVQKYQTIDSDILLPDQPYEKLPQITLTASKDIIDTDFTGDLKAQYTYFDHDDPTKPKGSRLDLMPSISYDWRRSWGFLKPKASVRYTSYDLDDHTTSSIDRTTSTLSLDGGLIFERNTSWFGSKSTQTLEPRFFYVYTPEEDQSNIPLFDTSAYTFDNATLFRENRFSGADRIGDANQVTLAVTTRFISDRTSQEFLSATIGQIYYFEDRTVQLDNSTPTTSDSSSFITTLSSRPAKNWIADAGLQWDNDWSEVEKGSLRIKYEDDDRHLFSARYQYDAASELDYTKLSAYWPVAFNTNLIAHSYYSLEENRAIETVAGFEHGSSCCWRVRALVRDYQINAEQDSNLSFFLQLELSGFAKLGNDIDSFLEDTIDGFVRNDD